MTFSSLGISKNLTVRLIFAVFLFSASSLSMIGQTPTDIQITNAVQQASVSRLGVNLSDQSYWDSGQLLKNLIFRNPGFEGMMYRSILKCSKVTANTCTDDNQYSREGTGFWTGGTYQIISGKSAGMTGSVVASTKNPNSCSGCGQIITFDQNINAAVGDYFAVTNSFPGHGDQGWWDNTQNGATITTEMNDLSPETVGKQALVLTATGPGQLASVASYFDSFAHLSFIQLNGTFQLTFRAKAIGGNNQLYVNVQRSQVGEAPFLSQTLTLTNTWQDYTLNFTANETGSSVGTVGLVLQAMGSAVELDDVSLQQTNSSPSNPTVFRDEVVNALKELNPGTIRMMAAGAALGSDLINQIQPTYARYREGFNSSATEEDDVAYGIQEFLQLCQTVNADPWITIPTATTPQEMTAFIEYLTGNGSDPYSALRISRGQTAPWTSVFNKIHIELGNETWNGDFKGESMTYPAYPLWANQVFGAARATNGFVASSFDLILNGWSSAPGYTQIQLSYSTQHDSVDIAPYLLYSLNNESQTLQFGALFAEPELWESPGGIVYQNYTYAQTAARPANLNVYEVNLGSMVGSPTKAQLDATQPSVGAGIAHADHMLQMMRLGVKYQNAFALPQYEFLRGDGLTARLWGLVIDMGNTNRRRPQFLTQALANSVIGGTMLQTVQTGANPTWNQPLSSDNVQLNGAHAIQSFAFNNNGSISVILFNLSQTTAYSVTLSGANAPSGTVQMSQITSANITDNNETSNTVQTATQTLTAFNPSTGLSLPPFSMTVLTSSANTVQPPTFSVAAGTYTTAQTVSLLDATPGATVYYTTDGSTPTTASTAYSGPITVSSTETLNAIAAVAGLTPSTVSTAAYVISTPTAATPTFSIAPGTYQSAQSVAIADSTPGASIYYTTDGSIPTTSSTLYAGPVSVGNTETINAIATAQNYTSSSVATATYTINLPAATPVFSVAAGTYASAQTVAITDATPGATIYFTTNGTVPTSSSTPYAGPITVNSTETISAIAVASNYSSSSVATATYTINGAAATPAFSVAAGTYASAQTVAITDATPGATIYFTTNGTVPTASSTPYVGPITVSSSETISAIAVASNYSSSAVATATYTINGAAATPVFSVAAGTYASAQTVAITDATPGATIYFTTNGTVPTSSSTPYVGPITVSSTETISAIAVASNYSSSSVATATYTINGAAATPVFSIAAGTYTSTQTVAITDATPGATIYFTTNGTVPTSSSTPYVGPITVSSSETISAIAVASNYTSSSVATASYTINGAAATPVFSIAAGTYASAQTVAITDATPGAMIYFTTNGTVPTSSSTPYVGPITVSSTETISAIAVASNYTSSSVATASYTINGAAATPVFSVASGTYASAQTVAITDATPGATIYFTTNGTVPTSSSTPYVGPITVSSTETISAIAVASNYSSSAVATATYTINGAAATPVFSVAAGTYASAQTVAITDATPGATIYFTTNGTVPTASSTPYVGPITVNSSETISAIAVASNYTSSAVATATYTINGAAATPVFSVAAGTYASTQTVAITDATPGATIYFTTNGTVPTSSSTPYVGPITVSSTETISAIAVASNYTSSSVATASYTINGAAATPVFSVAAGTYASAQTVAITDATPGATIYFTTNGTVPTSSSTPYVGPITVSSTETISAIAVASNYSSSAVASATYTINGTTATPIFSVGSDTYSNVINLTILDSTPGAKIYYTTDGSVPTTASSLFVSPISITSSETVNAVALAPNYGISNLATATYQIVSAAAPPSFSVVPGKYSEAVVVEMSDATAHATIYYTTDGSTPTTSSNIYSSPIEISKSLVVKAIAVAPKYEKSRVSIAGYEITQVTSTPGFSVAPGVYDDAIYVELKDRTSGATIYFTTDGSAPTTSSQIYLQPIKVIESETIKAIAVAPDFEKSGVASAYYEISQIADAPIFSLPSKAYDGKQYLTIKTKTPDAKIYFTINGPTPTEHSTLYVEPVKLSENCVVRAIAVAPKLHPSKVTSATYEISTIAAAPVLSLKAGKYDGAQMLSMKSSTPDAQIFYTKDGSMPTQHSEYYQGPFLVRRSEVILAVAFAAHMNPSKVTAANYEIVEHTAEPVYSLKEGTYSTAQTLSIKSATPGASIYFTTDGSVPNTHSALYGGPIKVSETEVVRAIAIAPNYEASAIVEAKYEITQYAQEPILSLREGASKYAQTLVMQTATPEAKIYYTTDGTSPDAQSTLYDRPITLSQSEVVRAIAVAPKLHASAVAEVKITIPTQPM